MNTAAVGLIGYGEVGRIFATDLTSRGGGPVAVYDLRFDDPRDGLRNLAETSDCVVATSHRHAAQSRQVVISAVTAGSANEVASAVAGAGVIAGAFYLDINSISPAAKREGAAMIDSSGGRYVEAVLMAPIAPRRLATEMLLAGPHARDFLPFALGLGFNAAVQGDTIGAASAVKMCRSIFVKGLEAVITECLVSARRHGVDAEVLASLGNTLPHDNWPRLAAYLISRTLLHGTRRSEEMREVVRTLEDAGLDAWMSEAASKRQAWGQALAIDPADKTLDELLDVIVASIEPADR